MILLHGFRFRNGRPRVSLRSMIAKLRDEDEPALDEAKKLLRDALVWILQFVLPNTTDLRRALPPDLSLRLQRAIFQFGQMYRDAGLGPERMLADLKGIFNGLDGRVPAQLREQLNSEIVRWCITAYYAEDTR
jgi:hypothetical protein